MPGSPDLDEGNSTLQVLPSARDADFDLLARSALAFLGIRGWGFLAAIAGQIKSRDHH